jgi:hypothetical protein
MSPKSNYRGADSAPQTSVEKQVYVPIPEMSRVGAELAAPGLLSRIALIDQAYEAAMPFIAQQHNESLMSNSDEVAPQ